MPAIKFDFVPERQIGKEQAESGYRVTIFKSGVLAFGGHVLDVYELDGKYLRLFADVEKKAIGWSVIEGKTSFDEIDDARILKRNSSGVAILGITKLLKKLGVEKGQLMPNLEVKKYKSALNSYDIYYIELPKEISKERSNEINRRLNNDE